MTTLGWLIVSTISGISGMVAGYWLAWNGEVWRMSQQMHKLTQDVQAAFDLHDEEDSDND